MYSSAFLRIARYATDWLLEIFVVFAALRCPLPDVANMDVVVIPPSIAFGESFVYNCKAGKSKIA